VAQRIPVRALIVEDLDIKDVLAMFPCMCHPRLLLGVDRRRGQKYRDGGLKL
jgi:hypothetical protein